MTTKYKGDGNKTQDFQVIIGSWVPLAYISLIKILIFTHEMN